MGAHRRIPDTVPAEITTRLAEVVGTARRDRRDAARAQWNRVAWQAAELTVVTVLGCLAVGGFVALLAFAFGGTG